MFALALVKLAEIIGEAPNRVSASTRSARRRIPWSQIAGTRNLACYPPPRRGALGRRQPLR